MSDPHAPRRVSATIKFPESARYKNDNPWLVFEGSVESVREQIIEAFGMTGAEGLNLFAVTANAQAQASGVLEAMSGLGGTILETSSPAQPEGNDKPASDVWAEAAATPEEPKVNPLIAAIENTTTTDDLKMLYAENQEAFKNDADLFAQWKAKGQALKAAG